MEALLQLLLAFENDESISHDKNDFIKHREIEGIACDVLIDSNGQCNWANISILKSVGFNVIPIEKDSFGWMIGGIVTKKGIITYG